MKDRVIMESIQIVRGWLLGQDERFHRKEGGRGGRGLDGRMENKIREKPWSYSNK